MHIPLPAERQVFVSVECVVVSPPFSLTGINQDELHEICHLMSKPLEAVSGPQRPPRNQCAVKVYELQQQLVQSWKINFKECRY